MKKYGTLVLLLALIVSLVGCGQHGTPSASPAEPLTQEEIYELAGDLLPSEAPEGLTFTRADRLEVSCAALWSNETDSLSWSIHGLRDNADRITSVEDKENYDLSLYTRPHHESVPEELQAIVSGPIFRAEELTQEAVNARAEESTEPGDSGIRMNFSVLYGETVVSISSKGVSPTWLYEQLAALYRPWGIPQTPSTDPIETVRSAIEARAEEEYTISIQFEAAQIDEEETAFTLQSLVGSEQAEARGWTEDYLLENYTVVRATYHAVYDHTKTPHFDGHLEQLFYLVRDVESGNWTVTDMMTAHQLDDAVEQVVATWEIDARYTLTETHRDGYAPRFDLHDARSGKVFNLPTMPDYAELVEIVDAGNFIFRTTGENSETHRRFLPVLLRCSRGDEDAEFACAVEDISFAIDEPVVFGDDTVGEVSDVKVTPDQGIVTIALAHDHAFGAYMPRTEIRYDAAAGALVVDMQARLSADVGAEKVSLEGYQFIDGFSVQPGEDGTQVYLYVNEFAQQYCVRNVVSGDVLPDDGMHHPAITIAFQ